MTDDKPEDSDKNLPAKVPAGSRGNKTSRFALNAAGSIPFIGGLFSAVAGFWSEHEQEEINNLFEHWMSMLRDEMKEKQITMIEVMTRLDLHDETIKERIKSPEYQSLTRK